MPRKVWNEITYPFPNFYVCIIAVENGWVISSHTSLCVWIYLSMLGHQCSSFRVSYMTTMMSHVSSGHSQQTHLLEGERITTCICGLLFCPDQFRKRFWVNFYFFMQHFSPLVYSNSKKWYWSCFGTTIRFVAVDELVVQTMSSTVTLMNNLLQRMLSICVTMTSFRKTFHTLPYDDASGNQWNWPSSWRTLA